MDELQRRGIEVVIPSRRNRVVPRDYDRVLYKERDQAERGFDRPKPYRRVATRYEKRSRDFLGMVLVDAIMIMLL